MTRGVWIFGLIAGGILAVAMGLMIPLAVNGVISYDLTEIFGYSSMLLAFILIFMGIRSERERRGGTISFGQAFKTGMFIALIASSVYVLTWQIMYHTAFPDFGDKYAEHVLGKMRAAGESQAAIDAETAKMESFKKLYKNPLYNIGITFLEVLPIGLLIALISAAILKRRPLEQQTA